MKSKLDKIIGIYKITSPSGKIYIGKSVNIKRRFYTYRGMEKSIHGQHKLYNSFKKHGVKNHIFEIIEQCNLDNLSTRERYWQDFYDVIGKNGLNCVLVSTDEKHLVCSEETKKKIGDAQRGELNHMFGKTGNLNHFFGRKHSEETKKKMSEIKKGKPSKCIGHKPTDETRRKISESLIARNFKGENSPNFGKKHTEDTKQKISNTRLNNESAKGGKNPKAKLVLNLETGIYYDCAIDACKTTKITTSYFKSMMNPNHSDRNKTNFIYC